MYADLPTLLQNSSSTRTYFISLPVWLQSLLHEKHSYIHTAAQLRQIAETLEAQKHLHS